MIEAEILLLAQLVLLARFEVVAKRVGSLVDRVRQLEQRVAVIEGGVDGIREDIAA